MRPVVALAGMLILLFAVASSGSAHTAALPEGYARLVGDCVDDRTHAPEAGLDLVSIEAREGFHEDQPLFLVRIVYGPATPVPSRVDLAFATPLRNGGDAVASTIALDGGRPAFVGGVEPAWMAGGLAVHDTLGRLDQDRVAFEVGYTYADIRAEKGHAVYNFEATSWHQGAAPDEWRQGDYMPGGSYEDGALVGMCTFGGEDGFFVAPDGFVVQADVWPADEGAEEDENVPPYADFTYTPTAPAAGEDVAFTDRSFDDTGIAAWAWDFGDGKSTDAPMPAHRYGKPGAYVVTLTVTDTSGETTTTSRTVHVMGSESAGSPGPGVVVGLVGVLAALGLIGSRRPQ